MKKTTTKIKPEITPQDLFSMSVAECIAAVAKDMRTRKDRFRKIEAHDLADFLGVPDPWSPGSEWIRTAYAYKRSLEEIARELSPVSEFVFRIEKKVSAKRFRTLVEKSANLKDSSIKAQFGFLTAKERALLEEVMALDQLRGNQENGICCIARYNISGPRIDLSFEGDIEDDGACIYLRTPYDRRDGKFMDLSNCVTDSY